MLFFALFFLLIIMGVPIAFGLGIAAMVNLLIEGVPLTAVAQRILTGADSFTLLAIPLYILAGELMEAGGISRRILDFAHSLVGHIRGGLGHVVVVSTLIMSGISGSSTADTAAIGSVMIPTMVRRGYSREKATAIIAAAGGMDILVPPCITMIVLGEVANLSVAFLFFAGIAPAVLMSLSLMAVIYLQARSGKVPVDPWAGLAGILATFLRAGLALLIPVIILGGIKVGAFTATEGAVVAVLYAAIVAALVYKELKPKQFYDIAVNTVVTTASIMLLVGTATLFAWITTRDQIPALLLDWLTNISSSPVVFLVLVNVILLFIGAVLEGAPAVIILAPLLMPIAVKLGLDPIHFGTVIIANIGVGFVLPPIGLCLLVASSVGKVTVERIVPPVMPFFVALLVALLLITFLPWVSLALPWLLGYTPVMR
ncbi:MAG: TRAP transporter large permease [Candidatus Methylomirabilales bacterium]